MSRLGIIGLGAMGFPIAKHIASSQELSFYARRPEIIEEMKEHGGVFYDSPCSLAAHCDVIIILVVNYKQCLDILEEESGVFSSGFSGTLVIMSTVGLKEIKDLETKCLEHNISVLDSPISGGVIGANNGTITAIVSGEEGIFKSMEDTFDLFSSKVFYLGETVGDAQVVKALNQLLVGVNILAVAEVFHYVDELGIENRQMVFDILKESAGSSNILKTRGQSLVDKEYDTGKSAMDIHAKDLNICLDIARDANISNYLTELAYTFFRDADNDNHTKEDAVSITKYFKKIQ